MPRSISTSWALTAYRKELCYSCYGALRHRSKTKTQAQIQKQWVEHYALSYSRWILDFGLYLSIHVDYLAKWWSVRSSSCTKTCRNALSKQMTNVLETCRNKNEKSASQILVAPQCGMQKSDSGKMPNRWKFELTAARFRISGHYEKQLTEKKKSKNGSEKPKSHIRMTMVEIEYAAIISPFNRSLYHLHDIVWMHKWYLLFF